MQQLGLECLPHFSNVRVCVLLLCFKSWKLRFMLEVFPFAWVFSFHFIGTRGDMIYTELREVDTPRYSGFGSVLLSTLRVSFILCTLSTLQISCIYCLSTRTSHQVCGIRAEDKPFCALGSVARVIF